MALDGTIEAEDFEVAHRDIARLMERRPDTRVRLRDRAIVLTLTLTGRRRS